MKIADPPTFSQELLLALSEGEPASLLYPTCIISTGLARFLARVESPKMPGEWILGILRFRFLNICRSHHRRPLFGSVQVLKMLVASGVGKR